jgi:alkylation response protein AidB-like acyl-CoA dehydrogenase
MSSALTFDPIGSRKPARRCGSEVRAFLAEEIAMGTFDPTDPPARALNERQCPGLREARRRQGLDRHDLAQEVWRTGTQLSRALCADGRIPRRQRADVSVFFTADRQSGPTIIKYGSRRSNRPILPRIVRGELHFCIGMSEPELGIRPLRRKDESHQDRRRLSHQRHEDLDVATRTRPIT